MAANLEQAIQDRVRELTDEEQRQVVAFVDHLKDRTGVKVAGLYSFVGIARSGNGSLSTTTESILRDGHRREGWSLG